MDPNVFYPTRHDTSGDRHGAAAKAVCVRCPAQEPCLIENLQQEHGIYGGAGEPIRRMLRRARNEGRFAVELRRHLANLTADYGSHALSEAGYQALVKVTGSIGKPRRRARIEWYGAGATHGSPATYAKGCRCEPCELAMSVYGAMVKIRNRQVNA